MRERRRWRIENAFDDKPHIKKWDRSKNKAQGVIEKLIMSNIALVDAAETASTNLMNGLGIKDAPIDMDSVEDLAFNMYLVKLAELFSGDMGANLSKENRERVMQLVCNQIFPPPVPVKPPPSPDKGEQILARIAQIRNGSN